MAALVGSHTAVTYALYAYSRCGQSFPLSVQRLFNREAPRNGSVVRSAVVAVFHRIERDATSTPPARRRDYGARVVAQPSAKRLIGGLRADDGA